MIYSNIVSEKKIKQVQLETIKKISEALTRSFGPFGSNTMIAKDNTLTQYTKDGHTILRNIYFKGQIEATVKSDLEDVTRHIVKTVGDGTTSAVILSSLIFERLLNSMEEGKISRNPYTIIKEYKDITKKIIASIKSRKKEPTLDDIYNIALISTNGNEEIAGNLKVIYENFGMEVFIDVAVSNTSENLIKQYDGMTLETGISDECFINDPVKNISRIRNARVYTFEDPIDTQEMMVFFDTIIANNIIRPLTAEGGGDVIPTVILAPKLSRDMSASMSIVMDNIARIPAANRPPLLIITNIYDASQYNDISKLLGAPSIRKYIDPKLQKIDVEKGIAPTAETIVNFFGNCECIEADVHRTKFINPAKLLDEKGEKSSLYKAMLLFLETRLKEAIDQGETAPVVGGLKRRINSLKSNLVEYLVGGLSMSDRDSLRDLVEDAVLNCRSSAANGVGFGSNIEGLISAYEYESNEYGKIIYKSYCDLLNILYLKCESCTADEVIANKRPFNMMTNTFDDKVLSSIESDVVVLEAISKIITLMITSNQFLCQTPMHNIYEQDCMD